MKLTEQLRGKGQSFEWTSCETVAGGMKGGQKVASVRTVLREEVDVMVRRYQA